MARQRNAEEGRHQTLRKFALRYPEAEEGIACKDTALECSAFKARKKTFFFLGHTDAKVKLGASLGEAAKLAAKEPDRYQVGSSGWVSIKFGADAPPPLDVLERWIDESYRLLVHKKLVAMLVECGLPIVESTPTAKKTRKKRAAPR